MIRDGKEMTTEEILHESCGLLAEVCALLFEIEDSDEGIAFAYMADAALRYGNAISKGRDPRLSEEFIALHGGETNE